MLGMIQNIVIKNSFNMIKCGQWYNADHVHLIQLSHAIKLQQKIQQKLELMLSLVHWESWITHLKIIPANLSIVLIICWTLQSVIQPDTTKT